MDLTTLIIICSMMRDYLIQMAGFAYEGFAGPAQHGLGSEGLRIAVPDEKNRARGVMRHIIGDGAAQDSPQGSNVM